MLERFEWLAKYWQPIAAVLGVMALFVVMNENVKANSKEVENLNQRQKAQWQEVELLKQNFVRLDERLNGVADKIDGQTRMIERVLDVVQKR